MKTNLKKSIVLTILLSFVLMPNAWAAIGDVFTFEHEGNTLQYTVKYTITDSTNNIGYYHVSVRANENFPITPTLIIPDKVTFESTEYSVTAIDTSAFKNCTQITSLVLPNTLKSIGSWSFYRCKLLTQITIPNQVNFIDGHAFIGCTRLKTIEFKGTGTTNVDTIPLNVSKITDNIANITLIVPNGCINAYVQSWHDPDLNIYEKSEKIFSTGGLIYTKTDNTEVSVRWGCGSGALNIGNSIAHKDGNSYNITSVETKGFYKTSYTSIQLGKNIKRIEQQAFSKITGMYGKTIVFPSTLEYIGNDAFLGCASTYEFTSNELPELGEEVFDIFSTNDSINENDGITFTIPSCQAFQSITANWDYPFFTDYASAKNTDKCSFNLSSKGENITNIPSNENQEHFGKITYTRTFTPGVWETLYLPFELEDMTVTVQGVNDGKPFSVNNPWNNNKGGYFHLAQLGSDGYFEYIQDDNAKLKGKNPYIIQFPSEDFKDVPVTFSSKDNYNHIPNSFEQADPTSDYAMYANTTLQPQKLNNPAYYLGTDNNFKHTGTYTLQPFECYLTPIIETQSYVNPRMMSVRFRPQSGVTTDVPTINNNPLLCQRNGNTLIIQTNGNPVNIYNINGLLLHSFAEGQEKVSVTLNSGCYIINSLGYTEKIIF